MEGKEAKPRNESEKIVYKVDELLVDANGGGRGGGVNMEAYRVKCLQ